MNQAIKAIGGEGILVEEDVVTFSKVEQRLIDTLEPFVWYSATYIIQLTGQREGLRRLRALRGKGWQIEKKRVNASREFAYRLLPEPPANEHQLRLL